MLAAEVRMLPLGPVQTNCYLLASTSTAEAAVIDPAWDGRAIGRAAELEGWRITHILLTHAHFDHVGGLRELKEITAAPVCAHPDTIPPLRAAPQTARMFGLSLAQPLDPDVLLSDLDSLTIGGLEIQVLYTPGHAPGHLSFYLAQQGLLFDGDVLFKGSIGRTDLAGGDFAMLMATIRDRLLSLPDDVQVLSGHGPKTTIGVERRENPFLSQADSN
jgi:glyoxylase-like metal-dependent hydrolase (beta-lactamase superfamily II)